MQKLQSRVLERIDYSYNKIIGNCIKGDYLFAHFKNISRRSICLSLPLSFFSLFFVKMRLRNIEYIIVIRSYFPNGPQPYDIKSCGMVQYCLLGCTVDWPFRGATREFGCSTNGVELSVVIPDSCR